MNIHQLSISYLHEQDRILVRINSADAQEIRLWLTRRLCLGWAPVLRDTLDAKPTTADANRASGLDGRSVPAWASEFQRLQNLKDSDFSTPFKSDAQSWPLGSAPLLVTTVHMAPGTDGGVELRFEESLSENQTQERSFQAALAPKLMHGFMHLLEHALDMSEWEQVPTVTQLGSTTAEIDDTHHRESQPYLH